jgi:hypothetical protein
MPLIAWGVLGAVGAGVGAGASLSAAGTQADAAKSAAQLQADEAQKALDFQKQEFSTQQQNIAPFLQAGQGAVTHLSDMLNNGGFAPWTEQFNAPTAATEQNDPGYQFRLQQGQQTLENSAAARGGLLSGGTGKDLQAFGQNYASNEYANVYNRALQQYQQNYNIYQQNQANQFNRYGTLAGVGQTAAGQLGQTGQAAAQNVGNISLTTGAQQGQDIQNAAAARASGYVGASNSLSGGVNNVSQLMLLSQLLNKGGGGGTGLPTNMPGGLPFPQTYDPNTGAITASG